jgi:hypothetical protein
MATARGIDPPFIGRPPHLHPLASRTKSPLTYSRVLPLRHGGWDPRVIRADPKREKGEPLHTRHVTVPWFTSALPSSQKPVVERVDRHTTDIQLHRDRVPFRLRPRLVDLRKGSRPACHVTGAPVTTYKKLHRHSRQYRASSTAEEVLRLEVALRLTQQCRLKATATGQSAAG